MTQPPAERGHEWCSLRLRFEERELDLLRGAEQVRGADLALHARRTALRGALSLARAGHKLRATTPGATIVLEEGEPFQVATFRRDGVYLDHRHPVDVEFSDVRHDAQRRDFTINGMFLDPETGALIDHVGGRADLAAGVVRAIGDPYARFDEDALRLLRAVRFAARFDYAIAPETFDAIRKLADERLGVTLALSLHAPDDELRDTLVPVNNRWKISEALDAARYYADVTGRRVSIEYALIRDVNDQPWRADLLGKRLHGALGPLVHVNLIPLNPTPGSDWDASPKAVEREFVRRVRSKGVSCTVRDTRGREISAACGQLAAQGG